MSTRRFNWGILGPGRIAHQFATGLWESPGMTHAHTLANMELMDNIRAAIGLTYPFEKRRS